MYTAMAHEVRDSETGENRRELTVENGRAVPDDGDEDAEESECHA